MPLLYNSSETILEGQNIRPPLGSFFNGQSYRLKLHPELGRNDRSVLVIRMVLQFQFNDGSGGEWTTTEKNTFASGFASAVQNTWSEKFRITTTSTTPVRAARDVGVVVVVPYFIDGWHTSDDFELSVSKEPSDAPMVTSSCRYSLGNVTLDSNDLRPENKGASMTQRAAVHEFGHMLGLRDEYAEANSNPHHTGDFDSIMNRGEAVRKRHYVPFGSWMTEQFRVASRLSGGAIDYKVDGTTDSTNALL